MNHLISRGLSTSRYRWCILLIYACANTILWDASAQAEFSDLLHTLANSDSVGDDTFGYDVAISETTAIVGNGYVNSNNPHYPSPQSVHVFDLSTGTERYTLDHSEVTAGGTFGYSVAIDGNIMIAGAGVVETIGEVYLFDAITGQKLRQLTAAVIATPQSFGGVVDIDDNKALAGAWGAAYVFDVTTGQELFKLTSGQAAIDGFGSASVAIDGNIAIIGAPDIYAEPPGAAYLFDVTTGQQLRKLSASDASTSDNFGRSVAIDGNIAIIGAPFVNEDDYPSGYAYVFDVSTGQQLFKLVPSDGSNGDYFGYRVDISGHTAIVGAPFANDGIGAAYLFDMTTGLELGKLTPPDDSGGGFGSSVAINGNSALVGAEFGFYVGRGAAWVFDVSRIPGDFNNDGMVDAADYVVWRNGLESTYTQDHYDVWRANFGNLAAGAAAVAEAAAHIPEPSMFFQMIMAAATVAWLRRGDPWLRISRKQLTIPDAPGW